ncbi:ABC transporter substrate-binding protein [Pararhizobium mangrovi]|uniref:ABC transporter substrate-binding protein n=1 Tax=Pararhizobium mangrovi TaxID=2590452 RepID=A0A506UCE5_9HYPH|nr:ABC transporter substrate-binding protein [Pararhizobium mangrovi]TPW31268.1 ABC transporter substrate-binding protein [Pararhizobium mangrovi]
MTRTIMALVLVGAGLATAPAAFAAPTSATIGMPLEPPTLDPTTGAAAAIDEVTYANIFQGLTRFAEDGSIEPDLARSWDISKDGLVYTFHLHDGVTFHDGSKMTASDVKFSLDRARGKDSANAQKELFTDIAKVEVVDPLTAKVTLSQPDGSFLFDMAWGDAQIVSEKTAAGDATHPIGTGPFEFDDWVRGDHITLKRYANYWGDPAKLETVTFRFISDPTAAFGAMMSGDLDAYPNYPAPENLQQFQGDPRFKVMVGSTEGETILAMNNGRKPFKNKKVREAVAHAIDREAIINGAYFGYGKPIGSHFAPQNPAYIDLTGLSKYDPQLSKKLLVEAGYPEGFKTTLKLPPPSYARRGGEIVAAQLRQVGIDVKIVNVEWAQWLQTVFKDKDYDLTIVSHTEPMDIGIYARDDYYFNYHSDRFKKIMAELDRTTDPEKRTELLKQAQKRIAEDYVNAFLFELPKLGVAKKNLMGLWKNSPTPANDLTEVHWRN